MDGNPGAGRRERKKRATLLALKAAALDLVGERGYANVTVEDIADAVDVSVRTFFNYFPSKEAAVVGDDAELIEAMSTALAGVPLELSPLEALRTVLFDRIRAIGEDIDRSGEGADVWRRRFAVVQSQPEVLFAYTKNLTVVERALTDVMTARLGDGDHDRLYAGLVTTCAIGAMRVAMTSWDGEGGIAALVDRAAAAFDLLAGGLASGDDSRPGRTASKSRSAERSGPTGRAGRTSSARLHLVGPEEGNGGG